MTEEQMIEFMMTYADKKYSTKSIILDTIEFVCKDNAIGHIEIPFKIHETLSTIKKMRGE